MLLAGWAAALACISLQIGYRSFGVPLRLLAPVGPFPAVGRGRPLGPPPEGRDFGAGLLLAPDDGRGLLLALSEGRRPPPGVALLVGEGFVPEGRGSPGLLGLLEVSA